MLAELTITDLAIIDRLHLVFGPGLVVFTGETGAGKSIIIDAVDLLLGGRADATLVRAGAELARVEALFALSGEVRADVLPLLEREALLDDDPTRVDSVTLAREVRREGRNVCRVNGRTVPLALLKELGQALVDVHGQSEHLSLLRTREHVFMLDRFGELDSQRQAVAANVNELNAVRRELSSLRRSQRELERRLDMLNFQIEEIGSAHLKPGEDRALQEERTRLANAEKLAALSDEAIRLLSDGGDGVPSAADLLGEATRALIGLSKIDPALSAQRELVQSLEVQFRELARDLEDYREEVEFNPKRLNTVEERIELIRNLQRKYGLTIEEVLAFAEAARAEREGLTHSGERQAELERQEEGLLKQIGQLGARLSTARRAAGKKLGAAIETELADLRMERAHFGVDLQSEEDSDGAYVEGRRLAFDATGLDRLEFLVAPNLGEGLKPLVKIASGGETARLMLALKGVLARADHTPVLIFDEIDQGIGGRVGGVVGRKLWDLARTHQVLCITHLPQLAAYGDQHFRVEKNVMGERTVTRLTPLTEMEQVGELAQMLGGAGDTARASAAEILSQVKADKAAPRAGRK